MLAVPSSHAPVEQLRRRLQHRIPEPLRVQVNGENSCTRAQLARHEMEKLGISSLKR